RPSTRCWSSAAATWCRATGSATRWAPPNSRGCWSTASGATRCSRAEAGGRGPGGSSAGAEPGQPLARQFSQFARNQGHAADGSGRGNPQHQQQGAIPLQQGQCEEQQQAGKQVVGHRDRQRQQQAQDRKSVV